MCLRQLSDSKTYVYNYPFLEILIKCISKCHSVRQQFKTVIEKVKQRCSREYKENTM